MEVLFEHRDLETVTSGSYPIEHGTIYELVRCPKCDNVILREYFFYDDPPYDKNYDYLYPQPMAAPKGLPDEIVKAYRAANRVRNIDSNAYAVLLRRVLEMVCDDRHASGRMLGQRLGDLAKKGEIPDKLVDVANGLKDFGNIGAHPSLGFISVRDMSILDDLCRAILVYVYTAPYLAEKVAESMASKRQSDGT